MRACACVRVCVCVGGGGVFYFLSVILTRLLVSEPITEALVISALFKRCFWKIFFFKSLKTSQT